MTNAVRPILVSSESTSVHTSTSARVTPVAMIARCAGERRAKILPVRRGRRRGTSPRTIARRRSRRTRAAGLLRVELGGHERPVLDRGDEPNTERRASHPNTKKSQRQRKLGGVG